MTSVIVVNAGSLEVMVRRSQRPRRAQTLPAHDSEFRFGSHARHITLPLGSNVHDLTAVASAVGDAAEERPPVTARR